MTFRVSGRVLWSSTTLEESFCSREEACGAGRPAVWQQWCGYLCPAPSQLVSIRSLELGAVCQGQVQGCQGHRPTLQKGSFGSCWKLHEDSPMPSMVYPRLLGGPSKR